MLALYTSTELCRAYYVDIVRNGGGALKGHYLCRRVLLILQKICGSNKSNKILGSMTIDNAASRLR